MGLTSPFLLIFKPQQRSFRLQVDTHIHPFIAATTGATSGTFMIPTLGETSANVWCRIHLIVKDSKGATNEVTRDILPRKSNITLSTNPAGLQLTLDAKPVTATNNFTGVVGNCSPANFISPIMDFVMRGHCTAIFIRLFITCC